MASVIDLFDFHRDCLRAVNQDIRDIKKILQVKIWENGVPSNMVDAVISLIAKYEIDWLNKNQIEGLLADVKIQRMYHLAEYKAYRKRLLRTDECVARFKQTLDLCCSDSDTTDDETPERLESLKREAETPAEGSDAKKPKLEESSA